MDVLDLAIKTLFSEFQEGVFKRFDLIRSQSDPWTFVGKTIKSKKYWYQQRYIDGKIHQQYFGPSTAETDKKVLAIRSDQRELRDLTRQMIKTEQQRAVLLQRSGIPRLEPVMATIISALSDERVAYQNGILVGSHAFSAYSGMLGVIFDSQSLKTLDVDIALDPVINISIEKSVDIEKVLKQLDLGFREVPSLSHRYPPHSFVGRQGLRVDILAPLRGRPRENITIRHISRAAAEPMRFLDFLIEDPVNAVLIGPRGGIPVTVPHPVRFALHKLIVSQRRPATELAKREKDVMQASQLIRICAEVFPVELKEARRYLMQRGGKWKQSLRAGIEQLPVDVQQLLQT